MKKLMFPILLVVLVVPFLLAQSVGSNAIDFTAVDINGKNIRLSDFNNKVVVLDFWATWCPPCRKEIPNLIDIKKTFKNKNFEIISIDGFERNSDAEAVKFVRDNGMDWIHIVNKTIGGDIANKYQIQYIPTMFILKKGKIVAVGLRGEELKKKIQELLD